MFDGRPLTELRPALRLLLAHAERAYRNERLDSLLDGHERALRHFGGVPLSGLYDNPRTITTGRSAGHVLWHPRFEDVARYYGLTPRACQPYRART